MKRAQHIFTIVAFVLALLANQAGTAATAKKYFVYVGTYTEEGSKSKGIYAYRYDTDTSELSPLGLVAETTNPSFLAVHPNRLFLYAVNEVTKYKGQSSGGVSAFAIDHATGKLTFLNEVPSRGADPCYITVDKSGKYVLVANYTGGSVATFPVFEDGRLGEAAAFVQHSGHATDPERQEGPHAHSIDLSPDNQFALADDLGLDKVLIYRFNSAKGSLTPNDPGFAKLNDGAGPRHFAFHPNGKFAYVISEIEATVTAFAYDPKVGALHSLQTISTLPKDFTGSKEDAEIEVHPSGKFLYASNRGHDSIAVFAIDASKGTLTNVDYIPTGGKTPRSFEIDPTGSLLFAANQDSNSIVIFRIDPQTGRMTSSGKIIDVGKPVCIKFVGVE